MDKRRLYISSIQLRGACAFCMNTRSLSRRLFLQSIKAIAIICLATGGTWAALPDSLPPLALRLGNARVETSADRLLVSTGQVTRVYRLTNSGLKTTSLKNLASQQEWISTDASGSCDWLVNKNDTYRSELVEMTARVSDDEQFTDHHISLEAVLDYPQEKIRVKYVLWIYPDAPGIRSQLQLRALAGFDSTQSAFTPAVTESFSVAKAQRTYRAFGYMQGVKMNTTDPILREEALEPNTDPDWANGLFVLSGPEGLILVKESNKHTHLLPEHDVATGTFIIRDDSVGITGVGMRPADLRTDKYLPAWANWVILYRGTDEDGQLALKQFDRRRYPVHERDILMMANTWGSRDRRPQCLYAAREENVLQEIRSAANLGLDMLQIDDGWQNKQWLPAATSREHQHQDVVGDYPIYPEGWDNVAAAAAQHNLQLGLWAAWQIPTEQLKINYDRGGFRSFKLDFAHLDNIEKRLALMNKARTLIRYANYQTTVNWDVTETPPRVGYFYGREYGNIYLENRKVASSRPEVKYVPHQVLQDVWLLAKYVNINKFQVTVQNVDMDPTVAYALRYGPDYAAELPPAVVAADSNLRAHHHPYVLGIALMATPIFFQETSFYTDAARQILKPLIRVYKEHRKAMYQGYVFPIGKQPDNRSWTGFQNYHPETRSGYLTVFRELHNPASSAEFSLHFVDDEVLKLTDLLTGQTRTIPPDAGKVTFAIDQPAGFKYLKYEILD